MPQYSADLYCVYAIINRSDFPCGSFEFRKYAETPKSKRWWDLAFGIGSLVPALLFGVAIGNVMKGLPIILKDGKVISFITFLGLLNPYSILIGILSLVLFTMHGAIYIDIEE